MQYLYNFLIVLLALFVSHFIKPFIGSYVNKKGENLATKEDIAQLTKIAEGIKAEISDKVWNRQKQWEMRRDAILEAMRDAGALKDSVNDLWFLGRISNHIPDNQQEKAQRIQNTFYESQSKLLRSKFIVRVLSSKGLADSLDELLRFSTEMHSEIIPDFSSARSKGYENRIIEKTNAVILEARKALDLKDVEGF